MFMSYAPRSYRYEFGASLGSKVSYTWFADPRCHTASPQVFPHLARSGCGGAALSLWYCYCLLRTTSGQLNISNRVYLETAVIRPVFEVPIGFYVENWV